jgi:hypothetical protein
MGAATDVRRQSDARVVEMCKTTALASVSAANGHRQLGSQISMFQVVCEIG